VDALEHARLAQVGDVHGERVERRRHHGHAGDAGDDHLQVGLLLGEDRSEQREEQQREQEIEERGARVAPEHPALQPVLAPRGGAPRDAARRLRQRRADRIQDVLAHSVSSR
jgi:hypothetical protein